MALRREDAHRSERRISPNGAGCYVYFFWCSGCGQEISSQYTYFPKHSGKCRRCAQKGKPFICAYTQMLGNKHKGRVEVDLSYEDFYELCLIQDCHYCGVVINRSVQKGEKGYRGYFLDRMDNNLPYTKANCVPCCWLCNQTKGNRFTYEQFLEIGALIRSWNMLQPKTRGWDKPVTEYVYKTNTHPNVVASKIQSTPSRSRRSEPTDEEKQIIASALTRFRLGRKRVVIFTNEGKGKKQRVSASNPVPPFNVTSLFLQ